MDDRMTIANMAIEAGGKNAIFEFDSRTAEYVDARVKLNGTKSTYEPVAPDKKQKFVYELVVNLDQLEPTVACHPNPGQRKKAKELGHIKLDRAYVGSCTGGKTSDFVEFARVLRGKRVTIDTFGVPATPEIARDLQTTYWGNQTIWDVLVSAGVQMTETPGVLRALAGRWTPLAASTRPASSASARRTGISPAAWVTRNQRCSSRRQPRWLRARLPERLLIRASILRIRIEISRVTSLFKKPSRHFDLFARQELFLQIRAGR